MDVASPVMSIDGLATSLSKMVMEALEGLPTLYPVPDNSLAVIVPFGSSTLSSSVPKINQATVRPGPSPMLFTGVAVRNDVPPVARRLISTWAEGALLAVNRK